MENQHQTGATPHMKLITAIFRDKESAESAYNDLLNRNYKKEEINLIMSDETRKRFFREVTTKDSGSLVLEDAAIGGAVGATIVGVIAAVIAVGTSILIPGMGFVIAGPLAAGLTGVGAGGITGGIVGALIGAGIPEEHATIYESSITDGQIIISFYPHNFDDIEHLEKAWKAHHGAVVHGSDYAF